MVVSVSPDDGGSMELGSAGGSGASSWWETLTAGLNAETVGTMRAESGKLAELASGGGFRMTEEAAAPLRALLAETETWVDGMIRRFRQLSERDFALGDHEYGRLVASIHVEQFTQGPDSIVGVLEEFKRVLVGSEQALRTAVEQYQRAEESVVETFKTGEE